MNSEVSELNKSRSIALDASAYHTQRAGSLLSFDQNASCSAALVVPMLQASDAVLGAQSDYTALQVFDEAHRQPW